MLLESTSTDDLSLLQKAVMPTGLAPRELYIHSRYSDQWNLEDNILHFHKGSIEYRTNEHISFDTFFGSLSLTTWCDKAKIKNIVVKIKVSGEGYLTIWHNNGCEPPFWISHKKITGECEINTYIDVDNLSGKVGIIYPEIKVESSEFEIHEISYYTTQKPINNVNMAVIMPTYKREVYVKRNIDIIKRHAFKESKGSISIFVIDNGNTLNNIEEENIHVIKNPNYGGAGGFARGVLEIINNKKEFTHVLFCDDDILIEPEAITRAFLLSRYLNKNCIIPGGMLNYGNRGLLHEIGARVRGFDFNSVKGGLDLTKSDGVISYDKPEYSTFFGWWFVVYPKEIIEEHLPAPFFVGWDDVQEGLALQNIGEIVTLAGVAVWHEEFTKKEVSWRWYYHARNGFAVNFLYGNAPIVKESIHTFKCLITYRYERAEYLIKGMQDAMKGPQFLKEIYPDEFHLQLSKSQKNSLKYIEEKQFNWSNYNRRIPKSYLRRLAVLLTLNGHLLPDFLMYKAHTPLDSGWVAEPLHNFRIGAVFRRPVVIYYEKTSNMGIKCEIDRKRFFKNCKNLFQVSLTMIANKTHLEKKWKSGFPDLTTKEFWTNYLNKSRMKK